MNLLSCAYKAKKKHQKFQIVDIFRQRKPSSVIIKSEVQQVNKFAEQLSQQIVSYKKIQQLSWNGIPSCIRPKIWKYLLKYMLINDAEKTLTKKRNEYSKLIENYWRPNSFSDDEQKIFHTIDVDVKRIGVQYNAICKSNTIQEILKRLLLIWHNRHPASGYVQGMCDISIPFLVVFLAEYLPYDEQAVKFKVDIQTLSAETLLAIEADVYWCVSKMIESVTSNYTQGFDGLRIAYSKVEQLIYKIDQQLYEYFKKEKIDLFALSFRNISTMLLRLFSPNVGIRLFDTFISYQGSFPQFMVFLFISIIQKFAKKLLTFKFEQLMYFLQNMPTKSWTNNDLDMIIAQAYCYQKIFSDKQP